MKAIREYLSKSIIFGGSFTFILCIIHTIVIGENNIDISQMIKEVHALCVSIAFMVFGLCIREKK